MAIIIFSAIWILLTFWMHFKKLPFFRFFIGSIGGFIVLLYLGKHYLNEPLIEVILRVLSSLLMFSDSVLVMPLENAVTIFSGIDRLSYFLTFECSAFVEMAIFLNVYFFFPLKVGFAKRGLNLVFGLIYLFAANIVRLVIMTYFVVLFGIESYFIAHVVVSRLVFMLFNIILYYYTMTLPHIKKQNVGTFKMAN